MPGHPIIEEPSNGSSGILPRSQRSLVRLWSSIVDREAREQRTVLAQLRIISKSLAELTQRTEPEFLQLASDLKELYTCAADLGRQTGERVVAVRQALEQNRISGPDGLSARSLQELDSGLSQTAIDLQFLLDISDALGGLHKQGSQMERIAGVLKASGYSFAVESARTRAAQESFGAFVEEMRHLAGKIGSMGETISGQSKSVQKELLGVTRAITGGLDQLRMLSQRSEATLRQTSEEMQQLLDSSWSTLQQAEERTMKIGRHANEAVYHLQFGDIVRQKLEHVVSALDEAAGLFLSGDGSSKAGRMDQILAVQAGQLELVCEEIESARNKLAKSFSGLTKETTQLVESVRHLDGNEDGKNPFENLKAGLLKLGDLQSQGRDLCEKTHQMSVRAIEASSQLSAHLDEVQSINRQMHLQSLNAIVKTALLGGEGETLGVLSMHVHTIFEESNALVADTVGVLERVTIHSSAGADRGADAVGDVNTALQTGLEQLTKVRQEFQCTTSAAVLLGQQQNERLEQARRRVDFLSDLSARIASLLKELNVLRGSLKVNPGSRLALEADDPSERYTMESEREVHRRMTGARLGVETKTTASDSFAEENMEFFDIEPAPSEDAASNVELF